jgi:hypothetical protein
VWLRGHYLNKTGDKSKFIFMYYRVAYYKILPTARKKKRKKKKKKKKTVKPVSTG